MSVVLPTLCRPDELRRCLRSLADQTRRPDEVVVVLPTAPSMCDEVVREFGPQLTIRAVRGSEGGIVRAVNLGLDVAAGDVAVLIDDDAWAPRHWLGRIEAWFRDPVVGAVGGPNLRPGQRLEDLPLVRRWDRFTWFGFGDVRVDRRTAHPQTAHFLIENNLAFRRSAVSSIDNRLTGRDERFGDDITLGLLNCGYRVVADPVVYVWHSHVRFPEPQLPDAEHAFAMAHNETYTWMKHLPAGRREMALVFGLLIGDRSAKGLLAFAVWAAKDLPRPRRALAVLRLVAPTYRGRVAGLRTYRESRSRSFR